MKNRLSLKLISAVSALVIILTSSGCGNKSISSATDTAVQTAQQTEASQTEAALQESTAAARVTVEGTKFIVGGKELWLNGVNTPWQKWNDFTGGMDEQFWDDSFKQLSEDGINCTRIWVNCNGESIVALNDSGEISSINENHWTDLDKLFAIAAKYKVYIMPTILSFDHFKGGSGEKWRALVTDKTNAEAFAEKYVKEFCKRYDSNEYVFSIDLMNEPDWVHENEECGQLDWDSLSYFFGKCAAAIHETSDMLVTVGIGVIKYNSDKREGDMISDAYLNELTGDEKAYVDFYSTHYYTWQKPWFGMPFNRTPERFGLDITKPCIIGETSNDDEADIKMTLTEKYQNCYDNGWSGVLVWMEPRDDGWYCYNLTQTATRAFAEKYPEKVYPLGK